MGVLRHREGISGSHLESHGRVAVRAWPPGSWSRAAAIHCSSPRSHWPFQRLWENCKKVFHPLAGGCGLDFSIPGSLGRVLLCRAQPTHCMWRLRCPLFLQPGPCTLSKTTQRALPRGLEREGAASLALQTPPTPALGASLLGRQGGVFIYLGHSPL